MLKRTSLPRKATNRPIGNQIESRRQVSLSIKENQLLSAIRTKTGGKNRTAATLERKEIVFFVNAPTNL